MTSLVTTPSLWGTVIQHLLPRTTEKEHAAFLFGRFVGEENAVHVLEHRLLSTADFAVQEIDRLELNDDARAALIKHAHDLGACLVEMHSHPGLAPAVFSLTDVIGLRETVPHMLWRLRGQPYLALVISDRTFDALVWIESPHCPTGLTAINVGGRTLLPTDLSLRRWR